MVDNEHEMGQRWAVGNQMYEIEPGGQPLVALWFGCDPVRVAAQPQQALARAAA